MPSGNYTAPSDVSLEQPTRKSHYDGLRNAITFIKECLDALQTSYLGSLIPTGTRFTAGSIKVSAKSNPESGWLRCDGSAVSRTTYSDLFAKIGTRYGIGDNFATFNLPDCRGRVVMGSGPGKILGTKLGSETQTLVENNLPAHTHDVTIDLDGAHTHTGSTNTAGNHSHIASVSPGGAHDHEFAYRITHGSGSRAFNQRQRSSPTTVNSGSAGSHSHTITLSSAPAHVHTVSLSRSSQHRHNMNLNNTGSGDAHSNVQPSIAMSVFIKT